MIGENSVIGLRRLRVKVQRHEVARFEGAVIAGHDPVSADALVHLRWEDAEPPRRRSRPRRRALLAASRLVMATVVNGEVCCRSRRRVYGALRRRRGRWGD